MNKVFNISLDVRGYSITVMLGAEPPHCRCERRLHRAHFYLCKALDATSLRERRTWVAISRMNLEKAFRLIPLDVRPLKPVPLETFN